MEKKNKLGPTVHFFWKIMCTTRVSLDFPSFPQNSTKKEGTQWVVCMWGVVLCFLEFNYTSSKFSRSRGFFCFVGATKSCNQEKNESCMYICEAKWARNSLYMNQTFVPKLVIALILYIYIYSLVWCFS